MSEQETTEKNKSSVVTEKSKPDDETTPKSPENDEVFDKTITPAKHDETRITEIINDSKEPDAEQTVTENDEPQSDSTTKNEAVLTENVSVVSALTKSANLPVDASLSDTTSDETAPNIKETQTECPSNEGHVTEPKIELVGCLKESSGNSENTSSIVEDLCTKNEEECLAKEEAVNASPKSNNNCPTEAVVSKQTTTPQSVTSESKPAAEPPSELETCKEGEIDSTESSLIAESHSTEALESTNHTDIASSTTNDKNLPENTSTESSKENSKPHTEPEPTESSEEYAEHVTYTDDGIAIYTDPKTQYKYKWCEVKNNWIPFEDGTNPSANGDNQKSNPYENEHYRWCSETNQWIPKTTAPTSSQTETEHYRWDAEKNEWILKSQVSLDNVTYGYEDGVRTRTDKDGAVFFWDAEKKAWFPKIDDDFMARYQMSYGFIDNTTEAEKGEEKKAEATNVEDVKTVDVPVGGVKRKAPPEPPKWFEVDATQNTKVYVSNLPLDITMEEFAEIMSKYGMIMRDPQTQKQKLKLYTEADGQIKGDGLCDYIKVESVDLALKLLDESVVRGNKIRVQRAKFQMRGEYNPTLKPKRKKKDKEKLLKMKEKLFDWRPEKMRGERSKHEKIVIIKNLFTPELFNKEVQLIIDYQNDLREECSKCGTVRKVVVYDRHAEGVAQINMADPDQADLVVQMMNGRFFGKRKLIAEIWDGKTKYKIAETEQEAKERISKWDKYLETEEGKAEKDRARLAATAALAANEVESEEKATIESVENVLPA